MRRLAQGEKSVDLYIWEASERVWSQSVIHYYLKLKMKFSLRVQKKASGVGMQFLILDFVSSGRLKRTKRYDFEICP